MRLEAVFPHAEEGEIVREEPIKELHGLGDSSAGSMGGLAR